MAVLRDSSGPDGTRSLWASLDAAGDLVIRGLDRGEGVERFFGVPEYEWIWTVRARHLPALRKALGAGADLLAALETRFKGEAAADLGDFLDANEIPYESWSRLGE